MPTDRTATKTGGSRRPALGRALRVLMVGAACLGALPAAAQQGLPPGLPTQTTAPTGADVEAIKKFVADRSPDLSGGGDGPIGAAEAARIKRARTELLEPLADDRVSPLFRIEYSRQLEPVLSKLAADPRDQVAVPALLIAGELATEQGVAIAEKQLAAKLAVIRFAAASAIGQTFEALRRSSPALVENRVAQMIDTLSRRLDAESDPLVRDTLARSLIAAMQVSEPPFQAIPLRAMDALATKVGARLGADVEKLSAEEFELLLDTGITTGIALRGMLTNVSANRLLTDDARRVAAGYAGDLLGLIGRAIKSNQHLVPIQQADDEETRAAKVLARVNASKGAALAEAIFALVQTRYTAQNLGELVKSAANTDDARFLVGSAQIHEQLGRPPFNFPAQRFAGPR